MWRTERSEQMKIPTFLSRPVKGLIRSRLPGFDPLYYQYWYRDVATYSGGALGHYLDIGWREGRDPSAGFSTNGYLLANPDVRAAGINPLVHFLEVGLSESRRGYEKSVGAPAPAPSAIEPSPRLLTGPRSTH